jgi:hypothetical protein
VKDEDRVDKRLIIATQLNSPRDIVPVTGTVKPVLCISDTPRRSGLYKPLSDCQLKTAVTLSLQENYEQKTPLIIQLKRREILRIFKK